MSPYLYKVIIPIYQKKNNTSLLYLSSFISKRSKRFYFLFLTAEKGTKRLPASAHKSSFTRRVLQLAIAQTNKTLLPRKTDFIDGLKAGATTATTQPEKPPAGSACKAPLPGAGPGAGTPFSGLTRAKAINGAIS
ncbi:hypothetical protein [Candidatus Avelusimicrobium alvi]|uniref:hypothetical protein n=1 Tax=Candidatus Avelusimicrobium alvi TaxID=3416221 RepID=UPI003D110F2E